MTISVYMNMYTQKFSGVKTSVEVVELLVTFPRLSL